MTFKVWAVISIQNSFVLCRSFASSELHQASQNHLTTQRKYFPRDFSEPFNSANDAFAPSWWASPVPEMDFLKECFEACRLRPFSLRKQEKQTPGIHKTFPRLGAPGAGGAAMAFQEVWTGTCFPSPTPSSSFTAWLVPALTSGSRLTNHGRSNQQTIAPAERGKAGTHHTH